MRVVKRGKPLVTHHSIDQVYAGIHPGDKCACNGPAKDHIVTTKRAGQFSIRCEHCTSCTRWDDNWQTGGGEIDGRNREIS